MVKKSKFLMFFLVLCFSLSACSQDKQEEMKPKQSVNIAALKGPTGIGMSQLMEKNEKGESLNNYNFTLAGSPDEIVAKIVNGEIDIAAVPTNLASSIYNKTNGDIKVAAINTLGVIYILENGNEINSLKDLNNKTIYISGKGSVPEYVFKYILDKNNINADIQYKTEHAELANLMAAGEVEICMLPEPYVTSVLMNNKNTSIAVNLTDEWKNIEITQDNPAELAMGCIVVRREFIKKNKADFDNFLDEYKTSTEFANQNIEETAKLTEKFGIMPKAEIVKAAIPNCNIVYIDGNEMTNSLKLFYNILFEQNNASIGGRIPDDEIYYKR